MKSCSRCRFDLCVTKAGMERGLVSMPGDGKKGRVNRAGKEVIQKVSHLNLASKVFIISIVSKNKSKFEK